MNLFHRISTYWIVTLFLSPSIIRADSYYDNEAPWFAALHRRYDELSPKGKAIAGATVGFIGSRLALKAVTRVIKFGAAAYITAEVFKMTGVMDEIPGKPI